MAPMVTYPGKSTVFIITPDLVTSVFDSSVNTESSPGVKIAHFFKLFLTGWR